VSHPSDDRTDDAHSRPRQLLERVRNGSLVVIHDDSTRQPVAVLAPATPAVLHAIEDTLDLAAVRPGKASVDQRVPRNAVMAEARMPEHLVLISADRLESERETAFWLRDSLERAEHGEPPGDGEEGPGLDEDETRTRYGHLLDRPEDAPGD